ncbi:slightly ste11-like protein [Dimargaris verticillata]|uniref:Slightly ste11-like protein n=1 Tax=Dimargaris verticillata TaxID=2761393 RepID=A0A9W8ECY6_9FUNG|nr:slightly ste11-like protein [Dimargaris verticillata]
MAHSFADLFLTGINDSSIDEYAALLAGSMSGLYVPELNTTPYCAPTTAPALYIAAGSQSAAGNALLQTPPLSPKPAPVEAGKPKRTTRTRSRSRSSPNHIPRPRNAFIIYRQEKHQHVAQACPPNTPNKEISKIIGDMWKNEPEVVKTEYHRQAEQEKKNHATMYPGYKYCPRKSKNTKKLRIAAPKPDVSPISPALDAVPSPSLTATNNVPALTAPSAASHNSMLTASGLAPEYACNPHLMAAAFPNMSLLHPMSAAATVLPQVSSPGSSASFASYSSPNMGTAEFGPSTLSSLTSSPALSAPLDYSLFTLDDMAASSAMSTAADNHYTVAFAPITSLPTSMPATAAALGDVGLNYDFFNAFVDQS